jgi:hypothetical protein
VTDEFESEVQKFVSRQNGGDLTPQIVYEMLKAVDRDGEERHLETKLLLQEHCAEDAVREERITALEAWRHEQATTCERRVRDLIHAEHEQRHEAHMTADHPAERRASDPPDADFSDKRKNDGEGIARKVWAMWGVGIFLAVLAANTLVAYLMTVLISGR